MARIIHKCVPHKQKKHININTGRTFFDILVKKSAFFSCIDWAKKYVV